MSKDTNIDFYPLDREINRTLRNLKKKKKAESSRVGPQEALGTNSLGPTNIADCESHSGTVLEAQSTMNQPPPVNEGLNGDGNNEEPQNGGQNGGGNANNNGNNQGRMTIKALTSSTINHDPFRSCPEFNINFELKGPLLSNLPKFNGLAGEDPHRHLNTMYIVCKSMKPRGTDLEEMCRLVFYFTLENKAKEWLMMLPHHNPNALASWDNLKNAFLERYFPSSKITTLTKDIFSAKQGVHESFYEYWCRFQELLAKCPHHQIPEARLVQYFHSGLVPQDRKSLDASAGGSIEDLTPEEAWVLIEKIASNNQQFEGLDARQVHLLSSASRPSREQDGLAYQMTELRADLNKIMAHLNTQGSHSQALVAPSCEICNSSMHVASVCPHKLEECSAMFQGKQVQNQRPWNPYSNTYNEGFRSHPNFSWRSQNNLQGNSSNQTVGQGGPSNQSNYTRSMVDGPSSHATKEDISQLMKCMNNVSSSMGNLATRFDEERAHTNSKFADVFSKLELLESKNTNLTSFVTQVSDGLNEQRAKTEQGLPSNTVINPKGLNAISLRSGKQVGGHSQSNEKVQSSNFGQHQKDMTEKGVEVQMEPQVEDVDHGDDSDLEGYVDVGKSESRAEEKLLKRPMGEPSNKPRMGPHLSLKIGDPPSSSSTREGKTVNFSDIPFPKSFALNKKNAQENKYRDMIDIFSKVEVNLPLLDMIKNMPACAKFLKDLCSQKRRCKPNECVQLSPSISALFKPHLPIKCKDPGSFTVPCTIGKMNFSSALLDLGAAINVMPHSIYTSLSLITIKPASVIL